MTMALVSLMFASCTKENEIVDTTDPIEEVDPTMLNDNPLFDNALPRNNGDGVELGCLIIDYPFSLLIDGEESEVDSDDDFESLLISLTDSSIVDFVYPLDITYEDGESTVIEDAEQLGEAFASCIPDEGWDVTIDSTSDNSFPAYLINSQESCFNVTYPVSMIDYNTGDEVVANNEAEFVAALANAELFLFFNFPLTLEGDEGEVTAEDSEELWELLLSCEYDGSGGIDTTFNPSGEILCYDIAYPFTVLLADGSEVIVNDHEEYCALMLGGEILDFVYPITLIDQEGDEVVINDQSDFMEALEDCADITVFGPDLFILATGDNYGDGALGCYDINYPISIDVDGEIVEAGSTAEVIAISTSTPWAQAVFPINITLNETGETVELGSIFDLIDVLENCQ